MDLHNDYFSNANSLRVTMICPNKRLVGVNVNTERMEVEEESLVSDEADFH